MIKEFIVQVEDDGTVWIGKGDGFLHLVEEDSRLVFMLISLLDSFVKEIV